MPLGTYGPGRGALYLLRFPGQPPFDARDAELMQMVGGLLEQGSHHEESRLLAQVNLLNRVALEAAGNPTLTCILKVALHELDRQLPFHVNAVWLTQKRPEPGERDEGRGMRDEKENGAYSSLIPHPSSLPEEGYVVLEAISSLAAEQARQLGLEVGLRLPIGDTSFLAGLRDAQAMYTDLGRASERDSPLSEKLAANGATSCLAVPLRAGDRNVGILQSACSRPSGFTRDQIQLMHLVADVLGPAISNCQLFGRLRTAYEELRTTQTQLVQAEKIRALGELAGGMAHEFNNSLCGVLGFLELALMNKGLDGVCRTYLESARTCALDAAQTVRRVQDFARQRRGDMKVQPLDVNELARQTLELTRPKWEPPRKAQGGMITTELIADATVRVAGCPAELREVLTNLVFNAVDAMPQGGALQLHTWSTEREVFLSVRDTGVGINEEVRQRLFEPFFTTKGEHGSGLGLSVAFGIIARHGGKISLDSQPGRGATFTVRLPAVRAKTAEHQEPSAASAVPSGKRSPPGLRVLVIEDDESVRRFLEATLTGLGHRPVPTADAQQGLAAFARDRFDVVLTDLGLPGVDGGEVARVISTESPQTPVILLTGWADQLHASEQTIAGVTKILGKPITIDNLSAALAEVAPKKDEG